MIMIDRSKSKAEQAVRGLLEGRHANNHQRRNVGEDERVLSVAAGSILAVAGLSRGSVPGLLIAGLGGALVYRGATGSCPAYQALEIDTASDQHTANVVHAFTIDKPAEEIYSFWRDFENLPRIMKHIESVRVLDEKRSHWVARAPSIMGRKVEWDAEITEDVPNERIAWRSLPEADVQNAGSISFEPSPRGTIVRATLRYVPPAGHLGRWLATVTGQSPEQKLRQDLRNLKHMMEVGEVPTIEGQPRGTCVRGLTRIFS